MTTPDQGVYLPPHLRKRAPTPAQTRTDVKLGDFIDVGLHPVSFRSQSAKPAQDQDLPDKSDAREDSLPSPPTTVEDLPKIADRLSGWDERVLEQSPAPIKRRENSRWPRTPKLPKERHKWPKSRDIPKVLSSGSQSDGGIGFQSDSEGDPSYDVKKLIAWNGDWLPPPEEWATRKGFTPRHFGPSIEKWADEHSRQCTRLMNIDSPSFSGVQGADGKWVTKDLVPRYWLHETIDSKSPQKFWEQLPHRAPTALSDVDIMKDPPYWERWVDDHPFIDSLVVPEARIDQKDAENELESPFALLCTTERLARIKSLRDSKERRSQARRKKSVPVSIQKVQQLPDRRIYPKANIYLRPVQPADIRGIMTIYNHYVKNTVHAHELGECSEATIRQRIDDIIQRGLPCLVAIAKRNQRKALRGYVSETVVGYIHLDDDVGQSSMYRFTFELELYVHPGYIRQGIGRCLLDQLLNIANTGYKTKGGYEWVNEFEYLKNGMTRIIKTILVTLHYERGDDVEWATSYLGDFGFKKAGRLAQIGHKGGKVVDKVIFQLQTTEIIDLKSTPIIQG